MRMFQFFIWGYILFNLLHLGLNIRDAILDYETKIETIEEGRGASSDFVWFDMKMNKDSAGVADYSFNTSMLFYSYSDSVGRFFLKNGKKVYGFYDTDLGTKMTISKQDYISMNRIGELGIGLYRLVYILTGFLILLFIRNVKRGKMFAKRTMVYLQTIGIVTIVFGFTAYAKNVLVISILKNLYGIKVFALTGKNVHVIMPFYILIGIFILVIAFCFGRGNYLEKQNDLTI